MPQLKPFQLEGAAFLVARTRALLADEPGVGKSGQIIAAANLIGARSVGVICPDIGVEHWGREFKKWGLQARPDVISWDDAHEYAKQFSTRMYGQGSHWDVLVPDECHFGKNPYARRTRSVFAKGGLAWFARRIWCASGTPAPNNASELYPMMKAFGKTKMGHDLFTRYYCYVDDRGKVRGNRPDRINELRAILKSFSLRRLKKDVLPELGKIDVQEWYVKPRNDFVALLREGCAKRGSKPNGPVAGKDGSRHKPPPLSIALHEEAQLRAELAGKSPEDMLIFLAGDQEFSTLRRYNALLKAPAVFETVKFELENGLLDKVVIYGYHKEALAALQNAFLRAGIGAVLIYGETPRGERDGMVEKWKREKRTPVLLASLMVASTVLDFTAAHQGIMLELDWVPGNNSQAMQRMHRHGQENPVTVRVAIGTPIDEIVSDVVLRKTRDLAEIFD